MAKREKLYEDFDESEFSYGSDFDLELFDDTAFDEVPENDDSSLAAWQRIERRQESRWLRNQVLDWDDWDEYFEDQ